MITEKWDAKIVDIDNAFLNRELEHEIYMAIPKGYTECIEQCEDNEIRESNLWISSSSKAVLQENLQCIITGKLQSKGSGSMPSILRRSRNRSVHHVDLC